ncbi:MAG: beta galactosidase jelly roll domain-containing protein [Steroidobacteraceae bacterium]|nr:beta galactosidase jelly roll domain-containing protein [Steroidobacteraceae bacterium]
MAFRQHSGGHTNGPSWPAFLAYAERYFSARPLLASVFRDHAVLQRERPVRVWGWSAPGDRVTVSFAGTAVASARADATGRWAATLPPMHAGGPFVLAARSESGATMRARDVLVGDVWLCSGQSNMVLQVHRALDSRAEIARSANDSIRMLTVPLTSSSTPLQDLPVQAKWEPASPETVPEFSAACFFFARELQKHVKVPLGLINASWGGSRIQAWMSAESLQSVGGYAEALQLLHTYAESPPRALSRWGEQWQAWWRVQVGKTEAANEPWSASPEVSRNWHTVPTQMGAWEEWGVPELAQYNGIVWYRTSFMLTPKQAEQAATITLGPVDEVDTTWLNGKVVGYTSGAGESRVYELAAGALRAGENTIAVAALDTYATGGMLAPATERKIVLADGTVVPLDGGWKYLIAPPGMASPPRAPWESTGGISTIYNAMIAPLVPYTLRGVVWYQGESNTEEAQSYGILLTAWMADWRKQFRAPDMPILVVQLANYGAPPIAPVESGWAQLREAQRTVVAQDEHAALAVTIDIGDRYDIHPANKQELGRRLARAARHVAYGEALAPSGPVAREVTRSGDALIVQFEAVEERLVTYGARSAIGFELCGREPGTCEYTEGVVEGDRVRIQSASAPAAVRVRYCWADSPVCTLYDQSGLPVGPFELAIGDPPTTAAGRSRPDEIRSRP